MVFAQILYVNNLAIFLIYYAKKVISFLTIIVIRSTSQNSGQRMMLRSNPNQAPLCALVMIPKIMFVGGIIAKIKQTIQSNPKYLLAFAILKSPLIIL